MNRLLEFKKENNEEGEVKVRGTLYFLHSSIYIWLASRSKSTRCCSAASLWTTILWLLAKVGSRVYFYLVW